MESKARQTRRSRRKVGVGAAVSASEIDPLLAMLPVEIREKSVRKANNAAARVVRNRARQLAPRSSQTGSTSKKSDSQKARSNARRFNLSKSIFSITKIYGTKVLSMVGPRRPDGNIGHLLEFGHAKVLWGKKTSGVVRERPFMRPAADATRGEQKKAVLQTLKKEFLNA